MSISIDLLEKEHLDHKEWETLTEDSSAPYYINQEVSYADILSAYGVRSHFLNVRDGSGWLIGGICLYESETKIGRILSHNGGPCFLAGYLDDTKDGLVKFLQRIQKIVS